MNLVDLNQLLLEIDNVSTSLKKHKEHSIQEGGYYGDSHLYDAFRFLGNVEKGLKMLKKEVVEGK